jgi:hypothetical protein
MEKSDLQNGDTLVDFQKGYAQEFKVVQENNELFLESGITRQKIEDNNLSGFHFLITSNDRI